MSESYKSSSYLKPLALSHCNVTREKLLFCTPQQHPQGWLCPGCCQALLTWDWAELSTVHGWCLPCSTLMDRFHLTTGVTLLHIYIKYYFIYSKLIPLGTQEILTESSS